MPWMARCYGRTCGSLAYYGVGPLESTPPHVPETGTPVVWAQTHHADEFFWCYIPGILLQPSKTHKASPEKRPSWSISRSGLSASTADLDLPSGMDCGSRNKGCNSRYSDFARVVLQPAVLRVRKHSYLDSGGTALAWKIRNDKKNALCTIVRPRQALRLIQKHLAPDYMCGTGLGEKTNCKKPRLKKTSRLHKTLKIMNAGYYKKLKLGFIVFDEGLGVNTYYSHLEKLKFVFRLGSTPAECVHWSIESIAARLSAAVLAAVVASRDHPGGEDL